MTLVFNEEGLGDVRGPCLLQSFVNHDAALFKVFVVGDAHFVVRRPSLKNFPRGQSGEGGQVAGGGSKRTCLCPPPRS